jgi:hypothetical protein
MRLLGPEIYALLLRLYFCSHVILQKKTPWPDSSSELYRLSDHRLSAKLVPTFADRGVSRSQRGGSPTAIISVF